MMIYMVRMGYILLKNQFEIDKCLMNNYIHIFAKILLIINLTSSYPIEFITAYITKHTVTSIIVIVPID